MKYQLTVFAILVIAFITYKVYFHFVSTELQPKVRGWLLASADGKTTGLVPHNYIKILGKRRGKKYTQPQQPQQQQQSDITAQPPTGQMENFSSTSSLSVLNPSRSQVNLAAFDKAFDGTEDQADFNYPGVSNQSQQLEGADGWASWTAEASQNQVPGTNEQLMHGLEPLKEGDSMDTENQSLVDSNDVTNVDTDKT